jgi:hypothetical protein
MHSTITRTVQAVICVDLDAFRNRNTYDSTQLDRVLRDYADMLKEGAHVRLRVHDLKPCGTAQWRTLPMTFQVEAANPWTLAAWVAFLTGDDQ